MSAPLRFFGSESCDCVTGAAGDAELVNYRVQGRYMVVDRLFAAAELRLGDRRGAGTLPIGG